MNKLTQPGFKSFITYVFSFIFFTLFIYLGIPFFFDYSSYEFALEKKILNNFGLHLNITSKAKYNIFPSPRLNLKDVEILSFPKGTENIGQINKLILKIPFKKLISLKKLDFEAMELIDVSLNIEASEIGNFKNFLNYTLHDKPIQLTKSKINLLDKTNLLFTVDLKKLNISSKNYSNKVNFKGRIFNTKLKINYKNINLNENLLTNITIALPEIGLNIKLNINTDKKDNYGRTSIFFPNNQFYFDYFLKNNILNISSSRLINNYFNGQLFGDLIFFPYLIFDLKLDINSLKFKNILNSRIIKNNILKNLIPLNNKINGDLSIKIDEIRSSSNIINSGHANLEFRNEILIVKEIKLDINQIGSIILEGKILEQKKKKTFNYNVKINVDNSKIFYSRFLIPKKNRIDLHPITLVGKINLQSFETKLEKVYFNTESVQNELAKNEILILEDKINEIFLQNSLENILKYSSLRKIIQSFFILN